MSEVAARRVLLADAIWDGLLALVLISGTWDGLYDSLDLPQALPALLVQLGGVALLGLAYMLWAAANERALRRPVATAGAGANAAAAAIIVAWLVFRDKADLGIGDQGVVELVAVALVLAVFAALEARIASRAPDA